MDKIIVIGGGGHARVVLSVLKKLKRFEICGYVDPENKKSILGLPYLGPDEVLQGLLDSGVCYAAVGVGQLEESAVRRRLCDKFKAKGFNFPSLISPHAVINEEVEIGEGTVIMDGVVVQPGSRIGKFSILNTNCSVDHDCEIGDFVHIAPGASLSGGVKVGDGCLIGTGASVIQYVSLVPGCIVGAGAAIQKDCVEAATYIGNPPRKVSS